MKTHVKGSDEETNSVRATAVLMCVNLSLYE
jgi:hypothetical protein